MLRFLSVVLAWFAAAGALHAEILTKPIDYKHGPTNLEGLLVYESTGPAKRPGGTLPLDHSSLTDCSEALWQQDGTRCPKATKASSRSC